MLKKIKTINTISRLLLVFIPAVLIFVADGISSVQAQDSEMAQGGVNVRVQTDESMSPQEQISWVREQTVLAKQIFERVKKMLDEARREKDTLKITCLDDKFTQIHVSIRGIEERTSSLEISNKSGDQNAANQNMAILRIYISRIFSLNSEAENCLGESDVVLGKTETTTALNADQTIIDILESYDPDRGFTADSTDSSQTNTTKAVDPNGYDDATDNISAYE